MSVRSLKLNVNEAVFNAVLASVILNELIAPPLVKYAIFKAGEQM